MKKLKVHTQLEALEYELEGKLSKVRDKIDKLIAKHGPDATIEISIEYSYGSESVRVALMGTREETDQEYLRRKAQEKQYEANERAAYERLKAKFGDS